MSEISTSCLVAAYPQASGLGAATQAMWKLGLFTDLVMFKIWRGQSEQGYTRVVKSRFGVGELSAILSLYGPSAWSRAIAPYSLVHFGSPHFFHLSKYAGKSTGTVYDLFYLDYRRFSDRVGYRWYLSRTMRYVERLDGVVTISHVTDQRLRQVFPLVPSTVIHPWTSTEFQLRDRVNARDRLGLPVDRILLLSVSTDQWRKNLDILPAILRSLGPKYGLVRIGPSERIRSRFPPRTLFALQSASAELYPLYFNAADVLVLPSRAEGIGVPALEAINSGLPVVASDIPVFREILGESYPYLANPDRVEEWVQQIKLVVSTYHGQTGIPDVYSRLGDYYRATRALEEYERFYRSLGVLG